MDKIVYALCSLTCAICAGLLFRGYRATRMRLLLWSVVCFVCLTLANIIVYVDLVVLPQEIDLSLLRSGLTFVGLTVLLYGMVKETV